LARQECNSFERLRNLRYRLAGMESGTERTRPVKAALVALALMLTLPGCSGDNIVTLSGATIVSDPLCEGAVGQFQALDKSGFILLVFAGNRARIVLADGAPGTCADLMRDTAVDVTGVLDGQTITAQTVHVR
jgi:hypothetical protein